MTAIETLEAAIARLEELRDGATPGVWTYRPEVLGLPSTTVMSGDETVGYVAVGQFHEGTAELVVAMRRAVDPLIALMRRAAAEHYDDEAHWQEAGKPHLRTFLKTSPIGLAAVEVARSVLGREGDPS